MAASANPTGNNQEGSSNQKAHSSAATNGNSVNLSNNGGGNISSDTPSAFRQNSGISVDWTFDEQSLLEDLLSKYASDSTIVRYAKIAMKLKDKTVRDVAFRCRWMTKKENGKRRKEDHHSARKNKDGREKATDSSVKSTPHLATRPNGPPYAPRMIPVDNDDGISYEAIGGLTGELLEQNAKMFNQISANFAAFQIHENVILLCKAKENIVLIMNESYHGSHSLTNDIPEVMSEMPPLPIKLNEELANSILPQPQHTEISMQPVNACFDHIPGFPNSSDQRNKPEAF